MSIEKERIYILLFKKLKHGTKEILKFFSIITIGLGLVIVMILIKYKPMYEVKISNTSAGYIDDIEEFEKQIETELININGTNASFVTLNEAPKYELKLVNREKETDEKEIYAMLNEKATVTYKYFAVTLENQAKAYVSTLEEATQVVEDIKNQYADDVKLNLQIVEEYTENNSEICVEDLIVAENTIGDGVEVIKEDNKYIKVNGIKIESMPINQNTRITISSRFGDISSIRSSAHKGLDIACKTGTDIKSISKGTVIFAQDSGSLGNLVKVEHGNGVQTWYAHCSKIYATVGQEVEAGEVIAAVGSTGNSTGPHLHLEIRVNGTAINPQLYLYNNTKTSTIE